LEDDMEQNVEVSQAHVLFSRADLGCLPSEAGAALRAMHARGWDRLPEPGAGQTRDRWRALAAVGAWDLSLVKLYEGHTDALAILAETGNQYDVPAGLGGVWAAEAPGARVISHGNNGKTGARTVRLNGRKAWCSGGDCLDWALVTVWENDATPLLACVWLEQPGVIVTTEGWHAVGMSGVKSGDVLFEGADGVLVGGPGAYLDRPGFWHGGAGVAACWYGAAEAIAQRLHLSLTAARAQGTAALDPYKLAHLGAVDVALSQARALLIETAQAIDDAPEDSAQQAVMRVRAACEAAATITIHETGRALGAAPYCKDARFARMIADLPVFLRQSHAEKDLAAVAACALDEVSPWSL
jgi:alkylation response protein AidB-like acyl-CoA dehydrogenase